MEEVESLFKFLLVKMNPQSRAELRAIFFFFSFIEKEEFTRIFYFPFTIRSIPRVRSTTAEVENKGIMAVPGIGIYDFRWTEESVL